MVANVRLGEDDLGGGALGVGGQPVPAEGGEVAEGLGLMQEVYKGNPKFVTDPTLERWSRMMQEGGKAAPILNGPGLAACEKSTFLACVRRSTCDWPQAPAHSATSRPNATPRSSPARAFNQRIA